MPCCTTAFTHCDAFAYLISHCTRLRAEQTDGGLQHLACARLPLSHLRGTLQQRQDALLSVPNGKTCRRGGYRVRHAFTVPLLLAHLIAALTSPRCAARTSMDPTYLQTGKIKLTRFPPVACPRYSPTPFSALRGTVFTVRLSCGEAVGAARATRRTATRPHHRTFPTSCAPAAAPTAIPSAAYHSITRGAHPRAFSRATRCCFHFIPRAMRRQAAARAKLRCAAHHSACHTCLLPRTLRYHLYAATGTLPPPATTAAGSRLARCLCRRGRHHTYLHLPPASMRNHCLAACCHQRLLTRLRASAPHTSPPPFAPWQNSIWWRLQTRAHHHLSL